MKQGAPDLQTWGNRRCPFVLEERKSGPNHIVRNIV